MTRLAFLDTETTSLRPDRRAWEVGLIVRDPGQPVDQEYRWFVDAEDLDLGNADPMALRIGRFYERHPAYASGVSCLERHVLARVEEFTRGAHLVGAVPNFDAEVLGTRMRAHGICPSWHYHLIDVEALAVGFFHGQAKMAPTAPVTLPWKSDDLSLRLGVTVSEEDRHTALGDARWARDLYDAVTGSGEG